MVNFAHNFHFRFFVISDFVTLTLFFYFDFLPFFVKFLVTEAFFNSYLICYELASIKL